MMESEIRHARQVMKYAIIVTMGSLVVLASFDTDVGIYLVRYIAGRSRDRW
jgi:hypothetical protein